MANLGCTALHAMLIFYSKACRKPRKYTLTLLHLGEGESPAHHAEIKISSIGQEAHTESGISILQWNAIECIYYRSRNVQYTLDIAKPSLAEIMTVVFRWCRSCEHGKFEKNCMMSTKNMYQDRRECNGICPFWSADNFFKDLYFRENTLGWAKHWPL